MQQMSGTGVWHDCTPTWRSATEPYVHMLSPHPPQHRPNSPRNLLGVFTHLVLGEHIAAPRAVLGLPTCHRAAVTRDGHIQTVVLGVHDCAHDHGAGGCGAGEGTEFCARLLGLVREEGWQETDGCVADVVIKLNISGVLADC